MDDTLSDKIEQLEAMRAACIAETEAKVSRIDKALAHFKGAVEEVDEVLGDISASAPVLVPTGVATDPGSAELASSPPAKRRSIRRMLLELLEESDRDWTVAEVLAEYEARNDPVHGQRPPHAMRVAVGDSHKAGDIFRTSVGRYKSVKWRTAPIVAQLSEAPNEPITAEPEEPITRAG